MHVLQSISYSLLVAFCYCHLPSPHRKGPRPPDHEADLGVRRTRCPPGPGQAAGSVIQHRNPHTG
jgi:hypothetical protein